VGFILWKDEKETGRSSENKRHVAQQSMVWLSLQALGQKVWHPDVRTGAQTPMPHAYTCFTWGPVSLRVPRPHCVSRCSMSRTRSVSRAASSVSICAYMVPRTCHSCPLHTHAHAGGLSSCSRWLLQMGSTTTCATLDIYLQHLEEHICNIRPKQLKHLNTSETRGKHVCRHCKTYPTLR
jgi:hypothetical protein